MRRLWASKWDFEVLMISGNIYTYHTGSALTQNYSKHLKTLSKWKVVPVPIQAYVCCQNGPIEILFYSNLQLGLGVGHITLPPIMGCSENLGKSGIFFPCPNKSPSTSRNLWCPPDIRLSLGGFQPKVAGYRLEAEPFQPQVVKGKQKGAITDGLKETMTWMG